MTDPFDMDRDALSPDLYSALGGSTDLITSVSRRRYVDGFVKLAGYEPAGLDDRQRSILFHALARLEELETDRRVGDSNWEVDFASYARQQYRHVPYVDDLLGRWSAEGVLTAADDGQPLWPDNKRFALVLSHDVDHLLPGDLAERFTRLKYLGTAPARAKLEIVASFAYNLLRAGLLSEKQVWMGLDQWMQLEARHGFRSSFFFFGSPLSEPCYRDSYYSYKRSLSFNGEQTTIGRMMRSIAEQGWDVGVHGSIRSHADSPVLRREREKVEQAIGAPVTTSRQHFLTCDVRHTLDIVNAAGIEADSTLGSNIGADYRCGTGMPFFTYDLKHDRPRNLLEIPLVVHDIALFVNRGMDEDMVVARSLEQIRQTAENGGAITLLWHNAYAADSGPVRSYERILEAAAELDPWGCSIADLNRWWRKRASRLIADTED